MGDFLAVYEPLIEDGQRHPVDPPVGRHLRHLRSGRAGARPADRARRRGRAHHGHGLRDRRGGARVHGDRGRATRSRAAPTSSARRDAARELRRSLKLYFAVDTLEFLRRGGRIGGAQAWIGSALKIKPILTIEREITPIERVRTAGRAFERLVDFLQERRDSGADVFFIQHIQAPEVVERLAERGAEIYGRPPEFVSEIGPVIGAHVGPGLIGVTGLPSTLLGPV